MSIPVKTPTRKWPSRIAAETECARILRDSGYAVGARITDPDHVAVLTGLVSIHPHATDKIGMGIDYFTVELMSGTPGQTVSSDSIGFVIHQVGGGRLDFSYIEAIYPSDQKRRVTAALKAEVDDLRLAFRDGRFSSGRASSDISGIEFEGRAEASVIYLDPSFSQLAYRFAESEGGWNSVSIESSSNSSLIGDVLIDASVRQRWRRFFKFHARPILATRSEGAKRKRVDETAWKP